MVSVPNGLRICIHEIIAQNKNTFWAYFSLKIFFYFYCPLIISFSSYYLFFVIFNPIVYNLYYRIKTFLPSKHSFTNKTTIEENKVSAEENIGICTFSLNSITILFSSPKSCLYFNQITRLSSSPLSLHSIYLPTPYVLDSIFL